MIAPDSWHYVAICKREEKGPSSSAVGSVHQRLDILYMDVMGALPRWFLIKNKRNLGSLTNK
jgi:hypothetical protein